MHVLVEIDAARDLAVELLQAVATPPETATFVAAHLVDADRVGHGTHGISRLPWYVQYVREGVVDPAGRPTLEAPGARLPCVSANWGFSHPAADEAMRKACEYADGDGIGAAALVRATHVGRLGAYVEAAAESGYVAIALFGGMGGGRLVAPPGSVEGLLGANPIAIGFPCTSQPPIVIDFTTAATTIGRIVQARNAGVKLPAPDLVGPDGMPTDDPVVLERGGAICAFGGHKGFALAVGIELLTRVLTDAQRFVDEGHGGPSFRRAAGLFVALRADSFASADVVGALGVELRDAIRQSKPGNPEVQVLAPGDPELDQRASNPSSVPILGSDWEQIAAVAGELGVTLPAVAGARSNERELRCGPGVSERT